MMVQGCLLEWQFAWLWTRMSTLFSHYTSWKHYWWFIMQDYKLVCNHYLKMMALWTHHKDVDGKKSQKLKKKNSQTIKHLFVNKLNHTQVEFDSPSNKYAKVRSGVVLWNSLFTLVVIMILKDTTTSQVLLLFIFSLFIAWTSLLWRSTVAFT